MLINAFEKTTFLINFNDFAQKICQKLPFSNILLIASDIEFFEFGNKIYNQLLEKGSKVQSVILKHNNLKQLDDFFKEKELILEFRGAIILNKQILCHLLSSNHALPEIFYLQRTYDVYGIFENNNKKVEYYFYITDIDKSLILKNLAVRTLCLIDLVFYEELTKKQKDHQFFNKAKRQIISALIWLNDSNENNQELFNLLIMLEKAFLANDKVKYFSASVCSFLMQNGLFHLETNFSASNKIVKKYKALLDNKFQNKISYSERARLVSFFSQEKIKFCLCALYNQLDEIKSNISLDDKKEIKSLIKAYDKLVYFIEKTNPIEKGAKSKQDLIKEHKLGTCISVCGDTHLSINGMTFVRQTSFLQ